MNGDWTLFKHKEEREMAMDKHRKAMERVVSRLLTADEAGQRLNLATRSLLDKRFRLRLGLHAVKLGRALRFDEDELDALIEKSREHLPGEARR